MIQQVEPATKPEELNSIPIQNLHIKRKELTPKLFSDLYAAHLYLHKVSQ